MYYFFNTWGTVLILLGRDFYMGFTTHCPFFWQKLPSHAKYQSKFNLAVLWWHVCYSCSCLLALGLLAAFLCNIHPCALSSQTSFPNSAALFCPASLKVSYFHSPILGSMSPFLYECSSLHNLFNNTWLNRSNIEFFHFLKPCDNTD